MTKLIRLRYKMTSKKPKRWLYQNTVKGIGYDLFVYPERQGSKHQPFVFVITADRKEDLNNVLPI